MLGWLASQVPICCRNINVAVFFGTINMIKKSQTLHDGNAYLTLGHKCSSGSVRPERAAETTEVHMHWSRTRVQKSKQRGQEEGEGSKGRVDWGAVQEHREETDVRKQERGLQHPQGSHQDPSAWVSSCWRQIWKHPNGKQSCFKPMDSGLCKYELCPDTSLLQSNQPPTQEAEEVEDVVLSLKAENSLQEWTTFPLSCFRMEVRQLRQSWQWCATRFGRWRNGLMSRHNFSSHLYQTMSELSYHQPKQPFQQNHALSYPQSTQGQDWGTAGGKNQQVLDQGGSTVEQIFNTWVIIEKHLEHQHDLSHDFIDFKKAFARVWNAGPRQVLRSFNIEEGQVQAIQALFENSCGAVLLKTVF